MSKPEIILCDIDGTVADCEHRRKYIDEEIRVGDTVYVRDEPDSKSNPFIYEGEDSFGHSVIRGKLKDKPCELHIVKQQLRKKLNYKKFFEEAVNDPPLQTTIDIIKLITADDTVGQARGCVRLGFCSGRPEDYRKLTVDWLKSHGLISLMCCSDHSGIKFGHRVEVGLFSIQPLFMRPSGDMRPDHVVKKELYLQHIEPFYKVKCVFDDRDQVVKMWRSLGLQVYQVAEGNF